MEFKKIDLPILAHAYVPRIVKVGPIVDVGRVPQYQPQNVPQGR